jgi:hypothetical protein
MAVRDHLVATLPQGEPAVLVLDTARYHKRHAVRAHCQRLSDRLQPFFLPADAPQRHRIERRWRYLTAQLACQRGWNDRDRLIQATGTLLADLEVHFPAHDGRPAFRPAHNLGDSA